MSLEATYEIIDRAEKTGFADASEGRPARVIGFKFPNEARAYKMDTNVASMRESKLYSQPEVSDDDRGHHSARRRLHSRAHDGDTGGAEVGRLGMGYGARGPTTRGSTLAASMALSSTRPRVMHLPARKFVLRSGWLGLALLPASL